MMILLIMCMGIFVGKRFFPEKLKKRNEQLQCLCTLLLIFSMGVTLGKRENFLSELTSLGLESFLFFLLPTLVSLLLVFLLTRHFLEQKKQRPREEE